MKQTITDRLVSYIQSNPLLNQNRVAEALRIHRTVVNQWFNGRSEPSPKQIIKFIELNEEVDANWLIRGTEVKHNGNIQTITGNENKQEYIGGNFTNNQVNDKEMEISYLKQIIADKNEQIALLKSLLKK